MENSRRFIYLGVLVIAFIMLVSFFAVDIRYISKLEHQIAQRDSLIRELSFSDELVKEYFNIEKDSIGHKTSFSLKDEKKTRIIEHIETVKESTFSLNGKDISADKLVEKYNTLNSDYNALARKYNSLVKKFNSETDSLRTGKNISDLKLNSIQNAYGIRVNCDVLGNTYRFHISGTKQIDSALILLPYFRENLRYEQADSSWIIYLPKNQKKIKIKKK